jgi:hypothetical protein
MIFSIKKQEKGRHPYVFKKKIPRTEKKGHYPLLEEDVLMQIIKIKDPFILTAPAKDTQSILNISGRGIQLPGGDRTYIGFVFFIPEQVII